MVHPITYLVLPPLSKHFVWAFYQVKETLLRKNIESKLNTSHYLIDFAEAAPAQQMQQQVPLVQCGMVFKPVRKVRD